MPTSAKGKCSTFEKVYLDKPKQLSLEKYQPPLKAMQGANNVQLETWTTFSCDLFSTYLDNGVLVIHAIYTIHSQRLLQLYTRQTKKRELWVCVSPPAVLSTGPWQCCAILGSGLWVYTQVDTSSAENIHELPEWLQISLSASPSPWDPAQLNQGAHKRTEPRKLGILNWRRTILLQFPEAQNDNQEERNAVMGEEGESKQAST